MKRRNVAVGNDSAGFPKVKLARLRRRLRSLKSVLVAFSGGVDSTFLLAVAHEELGDRLLAVIARSPSYPVRELQSARRCARMLKVRHMVITTDEMKNPAFVRNAPDRCFHCKSELFARLIRIAARNGLSHVLDGSNADDSGDYRPGRRAAQAHGVLSPLMELGFTKADIRAASAFMKLPTASKPSLACLASRFPYGTSITSAGLKAVDRAENALRRLGFGQVRVRAHDRMARIEIAPEEISRALDPVMRTRVVQAVKRSGFLYVALDLEGYRTGSMNAALPGVS